MGRPSVDVQEHPHSANLMYIQMRLSAGVRIARLVVLPVVLSAIACVADGVPRGSEPANHQVAPPVESSLRTAPDKGRPRIVVLAAPSRGGSRSDRAGIGAGTSS